METCEKLNNLIPETIYDLADKSGNIRKKKGLLYAMINRIFEYEGLPETVDRSVYEIWTMSGGYTYAMPYKDEGVYVYFGGRGGECDAYYLPRFAQINNPWQNVSMDRAEIGKDCVIIKNDSTMTGIDSIVSKYATLIIEAELSLGMGLVATRLISIMTAKDEEQKVALDEFYEDLKEGKLHSVFDQSFVLDGIKIQPYASASFNNNLIQVTEIIQFLMGNFWRELGLRGAYNTKRENISESESKVGDETLLPLIDDMLLCRQEAWDECNRLFGTNVRVRKAGAWAEQDEDITEDTEVKEERQDSLMDKIKNKLTGGGKNAEETSNLE